MTILKLIPTFDRSKDNNCLFAHFTFENRKKSGIHSVYKKEKEKRNTALTAFFR